MSEGLSRTLNPQLATFSCQFALAGFVSVDTDFSRWFEGSGYCPTENLGTTNLRITNHASRFMLFDGGKDDDDQVSKI